MRAPWILLALSFGSVAAAQSPNPYPHGVPIPHTFYNETGAPLDFSPCGPVITDAAGVPLFIPLCPAVILTLQPGESYTTWWSQHLDTGQLAPPGVYFVNGVPYDTGAAEAAVVPLGEPKVGETRSFFLTAPSDPDALYLLALAGSSTTGIPIGCGLTFPLDLDPLLLASLTNPVTFQNFQGNLDPDGQTDRPALAVPADPTLAGLPVDLAFATLDPMGPCGVGSLSAVRSATIQP